MVRAVLHRTTSLLLALVFAGSLGGDAYGLHPCPHHGSRSGGDPAAASHAPDGPEAHVAGHPDAGAAPAAEATPSAHQHGPCTCIGRCEPGPAPTLVPGAQGSFRVSAQEAPTVQPAPRSAAPRTHAYLLPFANAPPSSSS